MSSSENQALEEKEYEIAGTQMAFYMLRTRRKTVWILDFMGSCGFFYF